MTAVSERGRLDLAWEWSGYWWLPTEPERKVPGTLRYEPAEGLQLSLIGGFEERVLQTLGDGVVSVMEGRRSWSVICGVAETREITLLDCIPTSSRSYGFGFDGPDKQTIHATIALAGTHLEDIDQEVFAVSLVSVENLNTWAGSSVFTSTLGLKDERADGRGSISVEPVDGPSVVMDDMAVRLSHVHTLPHFDQRRGRSIGRMTDSVLVRFESTKSFSLNAALDHAKAIQDLVSLATHRASAILLLQLRMPAKRRDSPPGYPARARDIEVYFHGAVRGDGDAKAAGHYATLFTCADIPFEDIMPRWWQVRQSLLAASNMILGLRYAPARYVHGNLLAAVGAAEVLHRGLKISQPYMLKADFDALRARLLEQTPEEHHAWVRSKIRNDPTLKERLKALVALPDREAMKRLVPDVEQWAKVATRARNDLAHTGQTEQTMDELAAVVNVTSAVVVMNLLQALGIPGERQRKVINDHPELRHTARQAEEHLT
ncbi:HEPN domain-containing protein [Micromonospora sp. DT233]|uniref:ApeA N-terminal domain 1-containing protein n=1 Tax=Micromonospora sp. DT233 TaxID=3393432 RepID=UPI003CFA870C